MKSHEDTLTQASRSLEPCSVIVIGGRRAPHMETDRGAPTITLDQEGIMTGRTITLLAAASLLVAVPVEAQVEGHARRDHGEETQEHGMMAGMGQMMSMHGASPMEGGMGSGMMHDGMMGLPGPAMILAARDALGLTEDQVGALEDLVQQLEQDQAGHMDGLAEARRTAAAAAVELLDEQQRAQLRTGMQLMQGMMGVMMGQMGDHGDPGAVDSADGHSSHHR